AVEALRQDARQRRLPRPTRPREQVGLPHLSGRDRILERPHDRLLPDDLGEALRAVFPVERGHEPDHMGGRAGEPARPLRGIATDAKGPGYPRTWEGMLSAASFRT